MPFRNIPLILAPGNGTRAQTVQVYPSQCAVPGIIFPNGVDSEAFAAGVSSAVIDPADNATWPDVQLLWMTTSTDPLPTNVYFTVGVAGSNANDTGNIQWNAQPGDVVPQQFQVLPGRNLLCVATLKPDCSQFPAGANLLSYEIKRRGGIDPFEGDTMLLAFGIEDPIAP